VLGLDRPKVGLDLSGQMISGYSAAITVYDDQRCRVLPARESDGKPLNDERENEPVILDSVVEQKLVVVLTFWDQAENPPTFLRHFRLMPNLVSSSVKAGLSAISLL
jgi:hypothetical protein